MEIVEGKEKNKRDKKKKRENRTKGKNDETALGNFIVCMSSAILSTTWDHYVENN